MAERSERNNAGDDAFDEFFDVVVVGYGNAGAVAAIAAHDQGAKVLLIEKMPDPGGISICAAGGLRVATDRDAALAYLEATNGGTTPHDVLAVMADGMVELEAHVRELARVDGAEIERKPREANYPFPGYECFGFLDIRSVPGFDLASAYPQARGKNGKIAFKMLEDNIVHRGIEVWLSTSAERLIAGPGKEVRGLWTRSGDTRRAIGARRGVVLTCGGFEAAPELQAQFWQIRPVLSAANRSNTGDGIRMAQDLGAQLWHMWHFHGSYGFRHPRPDFPYAVRVKRLPDWTPGGTPPNVKMSWILVDKTGRRFTNEYEPYMQDTGHRALDVVDVHTQTYPYIPSFLIVDDDGRQMYPLGAITYNDRAIEPTSWSSDNLAEVELGILRRADTIEELAALVGAEPKTMAATLDAWNEAVARDHDDRFGRPPGTMVPVRRPPFFVGEIWPLVSNTQGGPVHDARQRVIDSYDNPIPRLYEAGELGSIWGHLYLSGGNLSECFITGRIAGREAARNRPWTQAPAGRGAIMLEDAMPYTLDQFIADCRATLGSDPGPAGREKVRGLLERLLKEKSFLERYCSDETSPGVHVLYEDPEMGFQVLGHIYDQPRVSPPHDHGASWAIYGQAVSHTDVTEWERSDDGAEPGKSKLVAKKKYRLTNGHAGLYQDGMIHSIDYPAGSRFVRVTGTNLDRIPRKSFDLKSGKITESKVQMMQ